MIWDRRRYGTATRRNKSESRKLRTKLDLILLDIEW